MCDCWPARMTGNKRPSRSTSTRAFWIKVMPGLPGNPRKAERPVLQPGQASPSRLSSRRSGSRHRRRAGFRAGRRRVRRPAGSRADRHTACRNDDVGAALPREPAGHLGRRSDIVANGGNRHETEARLDSELKSPAPSYHRHATGRQPEHAPRSGDSPTPALPPRKRIIQHRHDTLTPISWVKIRRSR